MGVLLGDEIEGVRKITRQRRAGTAEEDVCADETLSAISRRSQQNLSVNHSHSRLLRSDQIGKSVTPQRFSLRPQLLLQLAQPQRCPESDDCGNQLLYTIINLHSNRERKCKLVRARLSKRPLRAWLRATLNNFEIKVSEGCDFVKLVVVPRANSSPFLSFCTWSKSLLEARFLFLCSSVRCFVFNSEVEANHNTYGRQLQYQISPWSRVWFDHMLTHGSFE